MNKQAATMSVLCAAAAVTAAACGSGGGTPTPPSPPQLKVRVVAANDLGMHCMDREFSVFSILPPYNVVHAQVVQQTNGTKPVLLDDTQVEVFYLPVGDPSGSINSTSVHKTDFWAHAGALFGANLAPGEGLKGLYMPEDAPAPGRQPMTWDDAKQEWLAEGIPITPIDDGGLVNPYPLMRIEARNKSTHALLAQLDVVVPVAQETDCSNCHATGGIAANDPQITWSTDPDLELQTKHNVLFLHDHRENTQLDAAQPVLCAQCHYSRALDLGGTGPQGSQIGHATFSKAMHDYHGNLDDAQGNPIFPPNGSADATCYQCHPGAVTKCLRGAMITGGVECLNCHGDMLAVGGEYPLLAGGSIDGQNDGQERRPWMDLPRCQSCHTGDALNHLSGPGYVQAPDGIRLQQAYRVGDVSASALLATNKRFAENTNNLYRFSKGHGGLACENCHGSTHAEWPIADPQSNDNLAAQELQGHEGVLIECKTCHPAGTQGVTMNGPHGMHNVNDQHFVDGNHEDLYEHNPASCQACHGASLQGTVLARAAADRTFQVEDGEIVHIQKGQHVSCTLCHENPDGD